MFNVNKIREDFPILKRKINGFPLIYFDNAATTQKPIQVINAEKEFYEKHYANIHRGIYTLSQEASELYEKAHAKVAEFINAKKSEIVFVKNTTEALNTVAYAWGLKHLSAGDEILVSIAEHHSNLIPWLLVSKITKSKVKFVGLDKESWTINYEELGQLISRKTKIVAVTHVSNVLGVANDIEKVCKIAHEVGAIVVVDAAQSVPHMSVDVKKLSCDFLAFSGHKMLGPTGIGALYGKEELLQEMNPFLGGGDMVEEVRYDDLMKTCKPIWRGAPWKYEAGTPNIVGGIGLMAAIDYLTRLGMDNVEKNEKELTKYALELMTEKLKHIEIYGPPSHENRIGIISFNISGIDPHDIALFLDQHGVAIRSGYHCAQPLHTKLGVIGSARASFYIYNTREEVEFFVDVLGKIESAL